MISETTKSKIIECIKKCGLDTDYQIIGNNMDNFVNFVYKTISPDSSRSKMSNLIRIINEFLSRDMISTYEYFIELITSSNLNKIYTMDIMDFPGAKYVSEFCNMPLHAILSIWSELISTNTIYCSTFSTESQPLRKKFVHMFVILCLRHIFTVVEYCTKYHLRFYAFTDKGIIVQDIIKYLKKSDMNKSLEFITESAIKCYQSINSEFVKEICTKYYNMYHSIKSHSISEIDDLLETNGDFILGLNIKNTSKDKQYLLTRIFHLNNLGYSFRHSRECPEPLVGLNTNTNQIKFKQKIIIEI